MDRSTITQKYRVEALWSESVTTMIVYNMPNVCRAPIVFSFFLQKSIESEQQETQKLNRFEQRAKSELIRSAINKRLFTRN